LKDIVYRIKIRIKIKGSIKSFQK